MVQGAQIAAVIAGDVLMDANFVEPGIMLRVGEGSRDQYGEWTPGALQATAISMVSVPVTGQERLAVAEGLRDEDIRTFYVRGFIRGLHYGLSDGDLLIHGGLGPIQNNFLGADRTAAETSRDNYQTGNPTWFQSYQTSNANLIRLTGFGDPVYQRYDAIDGHWEDVVCYRATRTKDWGAFSEAMGVRQDPGNKEV